MRLAMFDLDHTLLNGDSDREWGRFLVAENYVDADLYHEANEHFYRQYHSGTLNLKEYLDFSLKPLSEHSIEHLQQIRKKFLQERIEPMRQKKADKLLQQHRNAGDYLLMVTATNQFIAEPIAESMSMDGLIATELEVVDGRYTGQILGTPSFMTGKVKRLQAWLKTNTLELKGSCFYSDSINDLSLLEYVDEPIVVDADEKLLAIAKERGWSIFSLRDQ